MKKLGLVTIAVLAFFIVNVSAQAQTTQSGSVGVQGVVPSDPPKVGATISFSYKRAELHCFSNICNGHLPAGLLVKVF